MEIRNDTLAGSWTVGRVNTCPTARRPVLGHPVASNEHSRKGVNMHQPKVRLVGLGNTGRIVNQRHDDRGDVLYTVRLDEPLHDLGTVNGFDPLFFVARYFELEWL